ncbi:MAG: sigma-70 family RNA polymerase sigma factor [Anaerolineaceae bacterium]
MKFLNTQLRSKIESPEDFARFYEETHLSVFRYMMVLCAGNRDEAEEITADAFFRAWEKRQQFSGSTTAALGWVITIARNILIDHRRSEGTHPAESMLDEEITDPEDGFEDVLVDEEQIQSVLNALQRLPIPQGDILILRYMFNWSVKTIAGHLGLTENNVSAHLHRTIAKIQKEFALKETGAGRAG